MDKKNVVESNEESNKSIVNGYKTDDHIDGYYKVNECDVNGEYVHNEGFSQDEYKFKDETIRELDTTFQDSSSLEDDILLDRCMENMFAHNLDTDSSIDTEYDTKKQDKCISPVVFKNGYSNNRSLELGFRELFNEILDISASGNTNGYLYKFLKLDRMNNITQVDKTNIEHVLNVTNTLFSKLNKFKKFDEGLNSKSERMPEECSNCGPRIKMLESKLKLQHGRIDDEENVKKLEEFKLSYEAEILKLQKKLDISNSERESAFMRYVNNEKEILELRKQNESLTKDLQKSHHASQKIKQKLTTMEQQESSMKAALSTVENLRQELNCKDIKANWVETNLRNEISGLKSNEEKLLQKLNALESELSSLKSQSNDSECKECAEFGDEDAEENNLMSAPNETDNDRNSLLLQFQIEKLKDTYDQSLSKFTITSEKCYTKINNKLSKLEAHLMNGEGKILFLRNELERLHQENEDLRQELESCREREADLLTFTEKLTTKNIHLQSEYTSLEAKNKQLENDNCPLENRISELEKKTNLLENDLKAEKDGRNDDIELLSRGIAEKDLQIEILNQRLEEQQAENQSLKSKYSSSIRELTKELQRSKRNEHFEGGGSGTNSDSMCPESRTSSCNSLDEQHIHPFKPNRQSLIEKIVRLQRENAKYAEKLEFLEEHIAEMLLEIKKKTKILQHYILREQTGVLSSNAMDYNKAEMSKHGGIMSTLYNSNNSYSKSVATDQCPISLELSLEINRKLQAVLEDTLLKNITLKENIETLGKEIERLSSPEKYYENKDGR